MLHSLRACSTQPGCPAVGSTQGPRGLLLRGLLAVSSLDGDNDSCTCGAEPWSKHWLRPAHGAMTTTPRAVCCYHHSHTTGSSKLTNHLVKESRTRFEPTPRASSQASAQPHCLRAYQGFAPLSASLVGKQAQRQEDKSLKATPGDRSRV